MKKSIAAAAVACVVSGGAWAGGHYVPGVEGVNVASVPPPGMYYLGYLVNYNINDFTVPGSSTKLPGHNRGTVNALANRFVWITDKKFLGADYGMEAIVPLMRTSMTINAANISESHSGVGDIYLGPVVLGWHGAQWDAAFGAGFWLDSGNSNVGNGYSSTMLTGGATYHFDAKKTVSFSGLARYEFNGKTEGVRPGQQLSLEWGLGKSFGSYTLGLVGYSQWQTTSDKGRGIADDKYSVHAVGAEFTYPILSAGVFLKAAAYKEVSAKGGSGPQPKGSLLRFTVIKAF